MRNKPTFLQWIVSFGVGFSPVLPGTLGSLVGMLFYFCVASSVPLYTLAFVVLSGIGILASRSVLKLTAEKDPSWIVIDEAIGIMVTFFGIAPRVPMLVIGFALFRFLDSTKVFPLNRLERLKGEWGVLLDDVGAGLYANFALHLLLRLTS